MSCLIITDHKWKPFKYGDEIPRSVHKDYDYMDEDAHFDGWIKLRRKHYTQYMHLSDFMRIPKDHPFAILGYAGYFHDSFFSGMLLKISDDGEAYQIATFIS